MAFTEEDAQCFAIFWCFIINIRGPALYLHERKINVVQWALGERFDKYGPALSLAFWTSLLAIALPSYPGLFALATGLTAVHQFNALQHGGNQSYAMVFVLNISLSASCMVAAVAGQSLAVGVNAAVPSCVESYATLIFFAALAKYNTDFIEPRTSACTAHVMASVENLVAGTPLTRILRKAVDLAGPNAMAWFFFMTAVVGAMTESLVSGLMYTNHPHAQVPIMFAMHLLFAFTRYDFSAVAAGVMPLWGFGNPGAVSHSQLGILSTPWARVLVPIILARIVLNGGAGSIIETKEDAACTSDAKDEADIAKIHQLRFVCHCIYILGCPLTYYSSSIPPGSFLVGMGSTAQSEAFSSTREHLGHFGAAIVSMASFISFVICVLNGFGPFGGWKVAGSYAVLYSNIIVESEKHANHFLDPLLRSVGLPLAPVRDLVTVLKTNHVSIASQLVSVPIAPFNVFEGLVCEKGWERSGHLYTDTGVAWVDLSAPGRGRLYSEDYPHIVPYKMPYFQFRCLVSNNVVSSPMDDFYVV